MLTNSDDRHRHGVPEDRLQTGRDQDREDHQGKADENACPEGSGGFTFLSRRPRSAANSCSEFDDRVGPMVLTRYGLRHAEFEVGGTSGQWRTSRRVVGSDVESWARRGIRRGRSVGVGDEAADRVRRADPVERVARRAG